MDFLSNIPKFPAQFMSAFVLKQNRNIVRDAVLEMRQDLIYLSAYTNNPFTKGTMSALAMYL